MGTGMRIEQRRRELGMTQIELAQGVTRLGGTITQTGIDKIEKRDTARPRYLREIAVILGVMQEWLETGRPPKERILIPDAAPRAVPIVSWVSAGIPSMEAISDEQLLGTLFVTDLDQKGEWIALRVEGDSMNRISPPGSIILVNRKDRKLVPNACYVIGDGQGNSTYKRFRGGPPRFEPVSTNTDHESIFPDHEPKVIGRVRRSIIDM